MCRQYVELGLDDWEPGENDVGAGRNRLKVYLQTDRIKVVKDRCPNLWREWGQLHWRRLRSPQDRDAPEEEADINNHTVDALRYAVMSRPDPAEGKNPKRRIQLTPQQEAVQDRRKRVRDLRNMTIAAYQTDMAEMEDYGDGTVEDYV